MNKIIIQIGFLITQGLYVFPLFSQQVPTGTPPANNTNSQASSSWYRGGNSNVNGTNNILGTRWNSPIYFMTNSLNRMRLNGGLSTTVSGYNTDKGGFLGLGSSGANIPGSSVYSYFNTNSPLTMLHLNGRRGTFVQTDGYRPWMHTGITFTDNSKKIQKSIISLTLQSKA